MISSKFFKQNYHSRDENVLSFHDIKQVFQANLSDSRDVNLLSFHDIKQVFQAKLSDSRDVCLPIAQTATNKHINTMCRSTLCNRQALVYVHCQLQSSITKFKTWASFTG
jgi:hypothetical protein